MKKRNPLPRQNRKLAKSLWGSLPWSLNARLDELTNAYSFSLAMGDLLLLNGQWFVTHSGLLRLAFRSRCTGIITNPVSSFCDPQSNVWAFKATVYALHRSHGFVGFGDANPSNVSFLVHGSEMRIAETRAVNRALRKAYGIGICSVEELGASQPDLQRERPFRKLPPESVKKDVANCTSANGNGSRVRDRLCQIIRRHELDAELVKAYAVDFCGTKTLRDATREQVENFVAHLSDWAEKDRNALLCQLNSYAPSKEGAA